MPDALTPPMPPGSPVKRRPGLGSEPQPSEPEEPPPSPDPVIDPPAPPEPPGEHEEPPEEDGDRPGRPRPHKPLKGPKPGKGKDRD